MIVRRRSILSAIVMVLVGFVVSPWAASLLSGHSQDATSGMLSANAAAVCPLPDDQQRDAAQAWQAMAPVFQDPRCINCHGAVNPFIPESEGKHGGGKINPKMIVDDQSSSGFGTSVVPDWSATFAGCQDCHSGLPGWVLPGKPFQFVGKNALSLCQQMKQQNAGAQAFLDHIARDSTGIAFIDTGFQGTRGLGPDGIVFYEGDTGKKYQPEPIPGVTHAQFVQMAQAWVKAMSGQFVGDASCGCQPPSLKTLTGTLEFDANAAYMMKDQARPSYGAISGGFQNHEKVNSQWTGFQLQGPAGDQAVYVFTATNQIRVDGSGNFNSVYETTLGRGVFNGSGQIKGNGISHNPVQPGDDNYQFSTIQTKSGLRGGFSPTPRQPGQLHLYKLNGKTLYDISLGIAQIIPQFEYRRHFDQWDCTYKPNTRDETYSNASATYTLVETGDKSCPSASYSQKRPGPFMFGSVIPFRNTPNPQTGQIGIFIGGVYDPDSGVIDGSEVYSADDCQTTLFLDPLQELLTQVPNGENWTNRSGTVCKVTYTLKWHLQLPQQ